MRCSKCKNKKYMCRTCAKGSYVPNRAKRCNDAQARKNFILSEAVTLSYEIPYHTITRKEIAERISMSRGIINHYFKSIKNLQNEIIKTAVRENIPIIVAQGLCNFDPIAQRAPKKLKQYAMTHINS